MITVRAMSTDRRPVGDLLRDWRQRRRLSQLALALEADVSARHVSFVETGRSLPSREMLLHLAERLDVPLRDRNALLVAAGYAPLYPERGVDDPALRAARAAVDRVLAGHEPYPALAVDRHWTLVTANRALAPLLAGVEADLLRPPVNVLRLSLHPAGLAPRIANFGQWRTLVLERLRRQVEVSADPTLAALLDELGHYPDPGRADDSSDPVQDHGQDRDQDDATVLIPLRLRTELGLLSFFGTTTIFGTPVDITLAELAIESFFPADAATADALRRAAANAASPPPDTR
jgi:transcriptional regulator with XRE-family HTH domain